MGQVTREVVTTLRSRCRVRRMTQAPSPPSMPSAMRVVQPRTTRRLRRATPRALALALALVVLAPPLRAAAPDPGAWWPRLDRAPLDTAFVVTGDFGEYRTGHFHGGLDFTTGGVKGRPVVAGLDGEIVRVRASGVGYGRSLYLQARDGRLLVYGHLDAFDEPLASYVAAAQESSGQYEQDLWPAPGALRVRAGQRLAWTGDSGAGGPHFHLEIRRADMAYNPARAGLDWPDALAPVVSAVWLEPLDDASWVERSPAPRRVTLGARVDTVVVLGRLRAVLDAWDPAASGDAMAAWSTEVEWDGATTAVEFDSVSWAGGMSEIDYVYDRGRAGAPPRRALTPWVGAGVRLTVARSDVPLGEDAGTLRVRAGDAPRLATFRARDLAGHVTERTLALRPPRAGEWPLVQDEVATGGAVVPARFAFDPLPGACVRVTLRGAPAGSHGVFVGAGAARVRASAAGAAWVAVVSLPASGACELVASGWDGAGRAWRASEALALAGDAGASADSAFEWRGLAAARFEPSAIALRDAPSADLPRELARVSGTAWELLPTLAPLKVPFSLSVRVPAGAEAARLGLAQDDGSGWSWVRGAFDAGTRRMAAEVRRLGRFALVEDRVAPGAHLMKAPRRAPRGPYARWALEARLADGGSGIDARGSHFVVDGKRVPSEWDAEAGVLRWKPLAAPALGVHRVEVVAVDRSGNSRRVSGRVLLD
jgi:hypothetical protein